MPKSTKIKSVAIIGAGAAGAVTAAAFAAEKYYDVIRVFERRGSAGGTWIYDPAPRDLAIRPGKLPPETDPRLGIPTSLPRISKPVEQERFELTPIYEGLTTNVPSIAMSFSDIPFPYGPFVPHHVPKQYVEGYFSAKGLDGANLVLGTTVEDVSLIQGRRKSTDEDPNAESIAEKWKLTLRKYDPLRKVDVWWEEEFDAVILANGHYAVPFVPHVEGLEEYIKLFPGRVVHSKTYRSPRLWKNKSVLVIGNSASGHDIALDVLPHVRHPLYQSRRTPARWDGATPPDNLVWKPTISEFLPSGRIVFSDDTYLDDIDTVIYCTGYLPSYPFWNVQRNGRQLWDYEKNKMRRTYQHTFFSDYDSLAIVGLPRVLTFRSFEYQAVALARLWARRSEIALPGRREMREWERERESRGLKKFHDVPYTKEDGGGETMRWFEVLSSIAGLGALTGEGRRPPRMGEQLRWMIENVMKYPIPGDDAKQKTTSLGELDGVRAVGEAGNKDEWVVVKKGWDNLFDFI